MIHMMRQVLLLFIFFPLLLNAEESLPYKNQSFLILLSTKDYQTALKFVQGAERKLKLKVDLRGLKPHPKSGLTYSRELCKIEGEDIYPCYLSRGRFDDGAYLSIEHSSAYQNFRPGYYIVVAASGDASDPLLKQTLVSAKAHFPDAYIKSDQVYMGCLH